MPHLPPGQLRGHQFYFEKNEYVPTPRATKKSDKPWYGAIIFLVISRIFVRFFGFYRYFERFFGSWDPSDSPYSNNFLISTVLVRTTAKYLREAKMRYKLRKCSDTKTTIHTISTTISLSLNLNDLPSWESTSKLHVSPKVKLQSDPTASLPVSYLFLWNSLLNDIIFACN